MKKVIKVLFLIAFGFLAITVPIYWFNLDTKLVKLIVEDGATFEENALIKAAVPASMGYIGVADDSGLAVDVLDGAPGVYSARYAGAEDDEHKDRRNNEKLLAVMQDVPDEKRTARFVCVVCFIDENGEHFTVRGTCEGKIGYEKRGTNGFGYDPVFMYGEKSFAELSAEEKNSVSHRANALKMFKEKIQKGQ